MFSLRGPVKFRVAFATSGGVEARRAVRAVTVERHRNRRTW
jgi:hypothetical protein